ncbi:MAG: putative ABC transporter permease [Firmicutes bacterium]|nr:putative ABC transporter permease [Bacillota bacterium]
MKQSKWDPFRYEGLTAKQSFMGAAFLFVIAGISGWIYEELFYRLNDGYFSWRGHGMGPWLPIYAFGMVILLFLTAPVVKSKLKVIFLCAAVSGGFEYLVGWALYRFFGGLRLWDYNVERWNWGNIGGFVCIRSVLVFAVAAPILIYTLVPLIGKMARSLSRRAYAFITMIPFGLFLIDIISGYLIKGFWK